MIEVLLAGSTVREPGVTTAAKGMVLLGVSDSQD